MFQRRHHKLHHQLHHAIHKSMHQGTQAAHGAADESAQPTGRESGWHSLWHGNGRPQRGGGFGRGGRGGPRGMGGGMGGGFGFGGDDGEGDGFARGRKFTSDDLQLLLLDLINIEPSHGYELIKALQTRSNGFYCPSPGMVYPALTYLVDLGYVEVQIEGNRKCYSLSNAGREYLATNRERVDHMFAKLAHIAQRMDQVRRAMAGEDQDPENGGWLPEFMEARHAFKAAVFDVTGADEQRRVSEILRRATAEILGEITNPADQAGHDGDHA